MFSVGLEASFYISCIQNSGFRSTVKHSRIPSLISETTSYCVFHTSLVHKSQRNQPTLNHVGGQRLTLHREINFTLK